MKTNRRFTLITLTAVLGLFIFTSQAFADTTPTDILRQGLLGAGTGAIAAGASGGKAGKGAPIGAGTAVIGGALLNLFTNSGSQQPVVYAQPAYNPQPVYQAQPVYQQQQTVYQEQPVYGQQVVYQSAPVYQEDHTYIRRDYSHRTHRYIVRQYDRYGRLVGERVVYR